MERLIDEIMNLSETCERRKINVPEWERDVFVDPITLDVYRRLNRSLTNGDEVNAALDAVVLLAKDEDGKNLFSMEDKPKLLRAKGQADIILRLSREILEPNEVPDPLD